MISAVLVLLGAVTAWVSIDRLLSLRDERLRRGRAAWHEVSANRVFHSTGWEETVSPLESHETQLELMRRQDRRRAPA